MTKKEVKKETQVSETPVVETSPYVYGVQPFLTVVMIKDSKYSFRFEMPFNIPYQTCVEACEEVLEAVKKLRDDSMKKKEELEKEAKASEELAKKANAETVKDKK